MRRLVGEQLALGRQGKAFEVAPAFDVGEAGAPERVGPEHVPDTAPKLIELGGTEVVVPERGRDQSCYALAHDCAVADFQGSVQDLESLVELLFRDA